MPQIRLSAINGTDLTSFLRFGFDLCSQGLKAIDKVLRAKQSRVKEIQGTLQRAHIAMTQNLVSHQHALHRHNYEHAQKEIKDFLSTIAGIEVYKGVVKKQYSIVGQHLS